MPKASARLVLVAACAVLALAACRQKTVSERPPETGDLAVATVNDETIWLSDLKREAVAQGLIGDGEPLDVSTDRFRLVLNSVIDQKLLAAEARRQGLDKDAATRHRLRVAQDRILGDVLIERRVQQVVTNDVIEGVYQTTVARAPRAEEYRARQIVTATRPEAEAARAQLAAGAEIDSLALKSSIDPETRFNGGDLGYFTLDLMPEEYALALRNARAGEIVGPFQVDNQWVVMRVEDRRQEEPLSLEAARPQIVRFLTLDEVRETLENARRGARIRILVDQPPGQGASEPADAPPAPGAAPAAKGAAPPEAAKGGDAAPKASPKPSAPASKSESPA